jgi:hypothetical protein
MTPKLIRLWQQMSELTAPECASNCKLPHTCCSPEYCAYAEETAKERGCVPPTHTNHPTLPYMGPTGCIMPPHMRPMCTLHTCAINSFGFKPNDPKWTERYFRLRDRITYMERKEAVYER